MQINSIQNQQFGASISGDLTRVAKSINANEKILESTKKIINNYFPGNDIDIWISRPLKLTNKDTGFPENIASVIVSTKNAVKGYMFKAASDDNIFTQYIAAIRKLKKQDFSKATKDIDWIK